MKPIDPWTAKMLTTIAGTFFTLYGALFIFLIRWFILSFKKTADSNTQATKDLTGVIQGVHLKVVETQTKLEDHDKRITRVEDKVWNKD